jgi:hypothetical protein
MSTIYRNINYTKRNYEATNLVAAVARPDEFHPNPKPINDCWQVCEEDVLFGLTMIERVQGIEYWGYL